MVEVSNGMGFSSEFAGGAQPRLGRPLAAALTWRRAATLLVAAGVLAVLLGLPPTAALAQTAISVSASRTTVVGDGSNTVTFTFSWEGTVTLDPFAYQISDPHNGLNTSSLQFVATPSSGDYVEVSGPSSGMGTITVTLRTQRLMPGNPNRVARVSVFAFTHSPYIPHPTEGHVDVTVTAPEPATPPPVVTVEPKAGGASINAGENAVFVLTRTGGDMSVDLPVNFMVTVMATASSGDVLSGTAPTMMTIPATMDTVDVPVQTRTDADDPVMGTVTLTVQDPGNGSYTPGGSGGDSADITVTQVILPRYTMQPASMPAAVDEGDSLVFTMSLDRPAIEAFTVTTLFCGDSVATADDIEGDGMEEVRFEVNEMEKTFTIMTLADSDAAEGDETLCMTFSSTPNPVSAARAGASANAEAVGTIRDAAAPVLPTITVAAASTIVPGTRDAVFTLTRTGASTADPLTVNIQMGGSRDAYLNWNGRPTRAVFEADRSTVDVTVGTRAQRDDTEDMELTIQPGTGYTVGDPGMVTVTVREPLRQLRFALASGQAATVDEGDTVNFTLTLDAAATEEFTITYNFANTRCGDAAFDSRLISADDIQESLSDTQMWSIGEMTKTLSVTTVTDDADEPDEYICLSMESVSPLAAVFAAGSSAEGGSVSATVRNVDAAAGGAVPEVTVAPRSGGERVVGGPSGPAVFVLTRTGDDMSADLVVDFTLGGEQGAYSNPNDRSSITSETIPAGDSTVEVSVTTISQEASDMPTMMLTIDDPGDGRYTVGDPASASVTVTAEVAENSPAEGMPSVTGTAQVGRTLTAGLGDITDDDDQPTEADLNWQWQRQRILDDENSWADIPNEFSNTYDLGTDDEGLRVRVRARFEDQVSNVNEVVFSLPTAAVAPAGPAPAPGNTPASGTPTISGTLRVGEELAAVTTGISDADGPAMPEFIYQWRRADDGNGAGEADIEGATSAAYTLDAADAGKHLQVVVSFTDDGDTLETVRSAWTQVENTPATGRPRITGTFVIGEDVTAVTTGIADADGPDMPAFSYQWRRADDRGGAGAADIGTDSDTYMLDAADENKYLRVVVTFTDGGGEEESVESAWTPVSDRPATGAPVITGVAEVGRTLTVETTGITDVDGALSFSFAWERDTATPNVWDEIEPQTQASTYLLTEADLGRRLRVQVTATDDLGGVTVLTSAPTGVVEEESGAPAEAPAAAAMRIGEATEHSLALLAPNVAASTVQVLTSRFESIAAGGPGAGFSAAKLGGRPLGAFAAGASSADGAGGGAVSAANFTREVAALFGLNLPAVAVGGGAGAAGGGAGAHATGAAAAGASHHAAPGAFETHHTGVHGFDAQNAEAQSIGLGMYRPESGPAAAVGRGVNGADASDDWRAFDAGSLHGPDLRRLLSQSSFSVGLGAAHGAHGGAGGGAHWTLWGRGAASGFEGTEKDSALDVDGDSISAYLGADMQRGDLALGLAVGRSEGEVDYAGAAGVGSGELETELTSVNPYLHWTRSRDTSLYAMLGYGFGEATLKDAGVDASLTSDLTMRMLAAGLYHALSGSDTGRRYEVKLDAFWVDLESDGARAAGQNGVSWAASDSQSGRVRMALTGSAPLRQGGGGAGSLLAEGELAARLDAGDAQTSRVGAEVGGGLRWAQGGFSLSARGRVLLVLSDGDFEDYEEWGASLSASYRAAGAGGRGLRFSLAPAWGEVESGVDALFESAEALRELGDGGGRGDAAQRSSGGDGGALLPDRLDFELGYGLTMLGGRAELLPFGRFSFAGGGDEDTRLRLGTRFDLPQRAGDALPVHRLCFELFGETQADGAARDRRVGLEMKLGF